MKAKELQVDDNCKAITITFIPLLSQLFLIIVHIFMLLTMKKYESFVFHDNSSLEILYEVECMDG